MLFNKVYWYIINKQNLTSYLVLMFNNYGYPMLNAQQNYNYMNSYKFDLQNRNDRAYYNNPAYNYQPPSSNVLEPQIQNFAEESVVPENNNSSTDPILSNISTKFITTHKEAVRTAVFSRDGTLAATGSADMSIKLLDVSKMHFHNTVKNIFYLSIFKLNFIRM